MVKKHLNLAITGGGQAGYTAALEAAKKGLNVTLFEPQFLGGTCLNVGCIPTKAYLFHAKEYQTLKKHKANTSITLKNIKEQTFRSIKRSHMAIENSLKKAGVKLVTEKITSFEISNINTATNNYTYDKLILATGTTAQIPNNLDKQKSKSHDFQIPIPESLNYAKNHFTKTVVTNETIFDLESFPKSVTIIGGGVIGVEFAYFFSSFDIPTTIIEYAPHILPDTDKDTCQEIQRLLKRKKVILLENTSVTKITSDKKIYLNNNTALNTDIILIATGRSPNIPQTSLTMELTKLGYLAVNEYYQTNYDNIYAIGDINGQSLYAHSAADQAEQLIDYLINGTKPIQKTIPSVIYTDPSFSSIGITSNQITDKHQIKKISFGFSGKAQAEGHSQGWIKTITLENQLKGCQIFGYNGEELLPLLTYAIDYEVPLSQLRAIIYAHPTYSELLKEIF